MNNTVVHPSSLIKATADVLNGILALDPPEISACMVADEVIKKYPQWSESTDKVKKHAADLLRAMFDFGALRDEAATLEALDPRKMTHEEIKRTAERLQEIGDIFNAAADALENECRERFPDSVTG